MMEVVVGLPLLAVFRWIGCLSVPVFLAAGCVVISVFYFCASACETAQPCFVERHRTDTAERCVTTNAVVEHLDVVEDVGARCVTRFISGPMHALVLQAVEEAFARCVDAPSNWRCGSSSCSATPSSKALSDTLGLRSTTRWKSPSRLRCRRTTLVAAAELDGRCRP